MLDTKQPADKAKVLEAMKETNGCSSIAPNVGGANGEHVRVAERLKEGFF